MNSNMTWLRGVAVIVTIMLGVVGCGGQANTSSVPNSGPGTPAGSGDSTSGKGGSTARFAIDGDTLYTISGATLKLFDISEAANPKSGVVVSVAEDIETLFAVGEYLFIGAQTGMHIYDNTLAGFPTYVSSLVHARSCDPVIVSGSYAYLTLRGGTTCGGFSNELEIIDVSDIQNPVLLGTFPMNAPRGLGMLNDKLYVCDAAGLNIFTAADAPNIALLGVREDIRCEDVIPHNDVLITTGAGAVSQFKPDVNGLTLVSAITPESDDAAASAQKRLSKFEHRAYR